MLHLDISRHLRELGLLKKLAGHTVWQYNAYFNAAREIANHPELTPESDFIELPGVGQAINHEILEFLNDGFQTDKRIKYLEELNGEYLENTEELHQIVNLFIQQLQQMSPNCRTSVAGSIRRNSPFIHDVDLISTAFPAEIKAVFELGDFEFIYGGDLKIRFKHVWTNTEFDIKVTTDDEWAFCLLHSTGSVQTNIWMRQKAKAMGHTLNEHGLYTDKNKRVPNLNTEKDIFAFLGLEYIEPANR